MGSGMAFLEEGYFYLNLNFLVGRSDCLLQYRALPCVLNDLV